VIDARTYPTGSTVDPGSSVQAVSVGITVGLSLLVIVALWFSGNVEVLRWAIPACATLVGLALYLRYPLHYVRYSLWVWFLCPLLRRIVDWQFGFADPNFVLLTPFFVSSLAGLTLLRPEAKADARAVIAFGSCAMAILYGFVVGLILHPSGETVFGLVNWLCPLLFGLHLYLKWPHYQQYQVAISRSFLWMVLILGIYGTSQFFLPPAWDRYWLENVMETSPSFGLPEALSVHVWSTLNAPAPFANTMVVGLLLLFGCSSRLKFPAGIFGYLSLLLSTNRTAWIGWVIGFFVLLKNAKPRLVVRVILSILLVTCCLAFLANDPRVTAVVGDRVKTFMDLRHDESFGERLDMYRRLAEDALQDPFGHGLKNIEAVHGLWVDSEILHLIFSLGWLGSALFLVGMFALFWGREEPAEKGDPFGRAAKAILVVLLFEIISEPVFVNVTGVMFWSFAGMYLAALQYQRTHAIPNAQRVELIAPLQPAASSS
jgi:hypothetical protein